MGESNKATGKVALADDGLESIYDITHRVLDHERNLFMAHSILECTAPESRSARLGLHTSRHRGPLVLVVVGAAHAGEVRRLLACSSGETSNDINNPGEVRLWKKVLLRCALLFK